MKKGWEYKKLGEVCKTYAGGTPLKTCKEYYDGGTIPWLRSGEVCRKYIDSTELFITQKGMDNSSAKYYPVNTIVVAMYGATAAQVGILKIESTSNQAVCGILPNDRFVPEFLFYWFTYIKDFLASQAQGGAQPNISQVKIKNLTTPVPPLSEQKEIVEYLDSSFAKIDKLKENAAKNLEEAKALFQSALKDALEPKEGWEEKTLIKEFSLKSGDNLSAKKQIKGPYDVYGGNGVTGSHIEYNLSGKNILIGRVGALCGNIHFVNAKIWVTDNAFIVKDISEHWHMDFLTYELKYLNLNQYASQTAQPVISNKSMKDVMIMLPPLSEQQSIVSFLDSLNEKVNTLQQNYSRICNECDALKQAILRQVFE